MIDSAKTKRKIGKILKTLRNKALLSLESLAKISGVSTSTISRIENGNPRVQLSSIDDVCRVFEFSVWDIASADLQNIEEGATMKIVDDYIIKTETDKDLLKIIKEGQSKFKKATHLVDELIDRGFFKKYRKVSEVRDRIKQHSGREYNSSLLSNALRSNLQIMARPMVKGNAKLYKVKPR